jgi:hypothetical protein
MGRTFEVPAKPVLIPLFEGNPQSLLPHAQRIVAQWVTKGMLMRSLVLPPPGLRIPKTVFRQFRATATPSPEARVLIGGYADAGTRPVEAPIAVGAPPPGAPHGPLKGRWIAFSAPLLLGRFIAQFLQPFESERLASLAERLGLVVPIWPPTERPVVWPPPNLVTAESWLALFLWERVGPG